jgi:hypothetical protein
MEDEGQRLLTLGDHDVAWTRGALVPHQLGRTSRARVALAAGVRRAAGPSRQDLEHIPDDVEGQGRRERHAAGRLTISGRAATANKARISEAVIERVPRA